MSTDKTHNGWYNYETWCINLWLTNESDSDDLVAELITDPDGSSSDIYELSKRLREYVEDLNPLADDASMFSDLLCAALSDCNWYEIAEHWMVDYMNNHPLEGTKNNPTNFIIESDMPDKLEVYWPMYAQTDASDTFDLFERIGSDKGGFVGSFWAAFNRCVKCAVEENMSSIVVTWDFTESDIERYTNWQTDQLIKAQAQRSTKING